MSGTSPTAADYFGGMVDSYDSLIRRAVPRYDEMIDRLVEYLPEGSTRVLELGCGTGNLTLRLGERFPGASVTTVDAAPEMTALTGDRWRRKSLAGTLATVTARFEEFAPAPGSFDLVVSCMSLHHVVDKSALYTNIRRWLAPGGSLCFADELLGGREDVQRVHWDRWLEFCRRPGNCTEEEIKSLVDHAAAHDHYVTLADHGAMLSGAGFGVVDCVWRNYMYSVVVAS